MLWEHFLVLAIVFGIADEVMTGLAFKAPGVLLGTGVRRMSLEAWCRWAARAT